MDIFLNQRETTNQYYYALGQNAAFDLMKTARIVASRHIQDLFLKAKFEEEIRRFSEGNLNLIRTAASATECQQAIDNIKGECANLERQGTMLSLEKAKVFISIAMEKREKEIGYTIEAIGVILGGVQIRTGFGILLSATNYVGRFLGAHLIFNGASTSSESVLHLLGYKDAVGFMKTGYMRTAEFLGFDKKSGLLAYHSVDLVSSFYGVVKLTQKPEVWRLFRYLPADYYRKINTMSKSVLTLKIIGAGNKLRVMSNIYNDESY